MSRCSSPLASSLPDYRGPQVLTHHELREHDRFDNSAQFWSGTYKTRLRIVGDTNPCRHQAEPPCAGHAPNVTIVQYALFTLGKCCCLMFYLASPVTPGSLQQCVPSLCCCWGLFCSTLSPVELQETSVDPVLRLLNSASGLLFTMPTLPPNSVLFAKVTNVYLPLGYSGFKHKLHTQNLLFGQSE